MAETRKVIRATREITVNINGETFDALLIPRDGMVEIDFSAFPEDDPMRRKANIVKLTELDLELTDDLSVTPGTGAYRLTEHGAKRLLESL